MVGSVVTWFVARLYYAKAGEELKEETASLSGLINSLIEKQGETQLLLKLAVEEVGKVNPEQARTLGEKISTHQSDVAQVVERLEKAVSVLDGVPVDATTKVLSMRESVIPGRLCGRAWRWLANVVPVPRIRTVPGKPCGRHV